MATTLVAASAQAGCNAIVDLVDAGSGDDNGDISWETAGDSAVCGTELPDPAFGAASSAVPSVATLLGVTLTSTAAGESGGTVTKGKFRNKGNTVQWTDSVGTSGESINFTSNVLLEGDKLALTAYTFSVTGA